jgi:hypothetical protein
MSLPAVQVCAHHPGRRGFALCMSCRKVVCQECATTWEGVNHCRPCLALKTQEKPKTAGVLPWLAWTAGCTLLFLAAARSLAWSGALFARMLK